MTSKYLNKQLSVFLPHSIYTTILILLILILLAACCQKFEVRKPWARVTKNRAEFWFPIEDYDKQWVYNAVWTNFEEYSWLVEVEFGRDKYEVGVTKFSWGRDKKEVVGIERLIDACQSDIWSIEGGSKCTIEGEDGVVYESLLDEGLLLTVIADWFVQGLNECKPQQLTFKTGGLLYPCYKERIPVVYDPNAQDHDKPIYGPLGARYVLPHEK